MEGGESGREREKERSALACRVHLFPRPSSESLQQVRGELGARLRHQEEGKYDGSGSLLLACCGFNADQQAACSFRGVVVEDVVQASLGRTSPEIAQCAVACVLGC